MIVNRFLFKGDDYLKSVEVSSNKKGETRALDVSAVFTFIGVVSRADWLPQEIEILSRPGRLFGDAGTWTWETNGKLYTTDNPLIAANTKAKKLRSLLERQRACRSKGQIPFIEALVFCSAPELRCELQGTARYRICLRDLLPTGTRGARAGVMAAILQRDCSGVDLQPRGTYDRPTVKMVSQAIEQAGIRRSQRHRKVGDYKLEQTINSGPSYQDWEAIHPQNPKAKRRVRVYLVRTEAAAEDRQMMP